MLAIASRSTCSRRYQQGQGSHWCNIPSYALPEQPTGGARFSLPFQLPIEVISNLLLKFPYPFRRAKLGIRSSSVGTSGSGSGSKQYELANVKTTRSSPTLSRVYTSCTNDNTKIQIMSHSVCYLRNQFSASIRTSFQENTSDTDPSASLQRRSARGKCDKLISTLHVRLARD